MSPGDGWILIGPLIAIGLVGLLGAVFWRLGLRWTLRREAADSPPDGYADGLAIFNDTLVNDAFLHGRRDYGLLCPAAVTDAPEVADEIRELLGDAGIRATQAVSDEGRVAVLVFPEELDEARRLVGDTPAL
jgi:hypothetical protein